jgi:predicted secreted hydrolase
MKISLKIEPLFDDQELVTAKSTQIIYWEGAVEVKGVREGKPVRGKGYVELTGYAHPMAGSI